MMVIVLDDQSGGEATVPSSHSSVTDACLIDLTDDLTTLEDAWQAVQPVIQRQDTRRAKRKAARKAEHKAAHKAARQAERQAERREKRRNDRLNAELMNSSAFHSMCDNDAFMWNWESDYRGLNARPIATGVRCS